MSTPQSSPVSRKGSVSMASPKSTMVIRSDSAAVRSDEWVCGYDPDFLRAYQRQVERGEPINIEGYNPVTQQFRRGSKVFQN